MAFVKYSDVMRGTPMALMAREKEALEPYRLEDVQETGRELGNGSYAAIVEVIYKGLRCAGKKIHRILYEQREGDLIRRFEGECRLLSQLRHPQVVQFLGVYFDRETNVPVLVMEFLPTTLAECLDRYGVLPNAISCSVLRDVALGLRYLHGQAPPIIHRDLSANHVLLSADMTAKISNLRMAEIVNLTPAQMTRMTQASGTPCYMPPEALVPDSRYTTSIDVFSYGNMMIHVFSGKWPFPTEAARVDPSSPYKLLPISEAERRQSYLDDMGRDHPLRELAVQCISNNPSHRPTASEIHEQMNVVCVRFPTSFTNKVEMLQRITADSKEKQEMRDEIDHLCTATSPLKNELDHLQLTSSIQIEQLQLEVAELGTSLAQEESEHHAEIRAKDAEIFQLQAKLQSKEEQHRAQIRAKEEEVRAKEAEIAAVEASTNVIISSKEEIIASKVAKLGMKDATVSGLAQQISHLQHCITAKQLPHLLQPRAQLKWDTCTPLPEKGMTSQAIIIGTILYCCLEESQVLRCDFQEQWTALPSLPCHTFGLGQLSGQLVAIGGRTGESDVTNKVRVFETTSGEWKESIPPMPHARYGASVISYNSTLVVCGGRIKYCALCSVDVYKSEASQWYSTSPLPFPWTGMRSTVIGEMCYLVGGEAGIKCRDATKAVLTASLPALLDPSRAYRYSPSHSPLHPTKSPEAVWSQLHDVPLFSSAVASLGGSLLALGGQNKPSHEHVCRSVYVYSPTTSSWIQIQDLPVPCAHFSAVTMPCTGELRILGGKVKRSENTNAVFKAAIQA